MIKQTSTLLLLLISINVFTQEFGQFTDSRDGKTYKTVKIGEQIWMAENLAYKIDSGCWAYNNNENNVSKYGYYYNWKAAQKVCPSGWILPNFDNIKTLLKEVGNNYNERYIALKHGGSSGFSARFFGSHSQWDTFMGFGEKARFWSSSPPNTTYGWYLDLTGRGANALTHSKIWGFSVRCIKNQDSN